MDFLKINQAIKLQEAISIMSKYPEEFGMGVVVDNSDKFLGIITLGDLSRIIKKDPMLLEERLEKYYNRKPFYFYNPITDEEVLNIIKKKKKGNKLPRYIPILSENRKVDRLVNTYKVSAKNINYLPKVLIIGMGFVGITIALALARKNQEVIGYDINNEVIKKLKKSKSHVDEPGINSLIKKYNEEGKLKFTNSISNFNYDTYVICVGTPVDVNKTPNTRFLLSSLKDISRTIRPGNLIIIRSTVGLGTTRNIIIPELERLTQLKVGKDIFVSFSPERTVQGNALYEIENLPQLVSGFSSDCLYKSIDFWRQISNSVIQLDSLEACELAKLANNSYRDLTFAFANGLSQICSNYQIDSAKLINSINEGYPRSLIPKPSPGVGGYCLTKDPYILSSSKSCPMEFKKILISSREVNDSQIDYVINHLNIYLKTNNFTLKDLNILIIGLAFKGVPQTNDIRGSNAIDLHKKIKGKVNSVYGFDVALKSNTIIPDLISISNFDSLKKTIKKVNAIFIMNNNPNNLPDDFLNYLDKGIFLSDPWGFYSNFDVVNNCKISYSNLGKLDLYIK